MELELEKQAIALAEAFLCGAGVGAVYDLLRPLRRRSGKILENTLDALFCLLAFASAFLLGQHTYKGRLGLWELLGMTLGFAAYMGSLSPWFLRLIETILELFSSIFLRAMKALKKSHDFLKNFFPNKQ